MTLIIFQVITQTISHRVGGLAPRDHVARCKQFLR